jgi:hypothetical protein
MNNKSHNDVIFLLKDNYEYIYCFAKDPDDDGAEILVTSLLIAFSAFYILSHKSRMQLTGKLRI